MGLNAFRDLIQSNQNKMYGILTLRLVPLVFFRVVVVVAIGVGV